VFHESKVSSTTADIPSLDKLSIDYATVNSLVLAPRCNTCHNTAAARRPALNSADLVLKQVVPGHPEQSPLYTSLQQFGGLMPKNQAPLTPNQVLLIEAWIKVGAPGSASTCPVPIVDPPPVEMAIEPTLSDIRSKVFSTYCYACHLGAMAEGSTDLSSYDDLVNNILEPDTIVPGHPETSVLYKDLTSKRMPRREPCHALAKVLSESAKQAINQWILNGAVDN
jgi:hypothetical protein